jgi:hypothetical protein
MDGKAYTLMFIGIILSGFFGYAMGIVYIPEFVDVYFPDNYRARFIGLTQIHEVAVSKIEGLGEENEGLHASIEALQGQYANLDKAYKNSEGNKTALQTAYFTLKNDNEALGETLNKTQESYDTLLMQYMIVTGNAPSSTFTTTTTTGSVCLQRTIPFTSPIRLMTSICPRS